MLFDHVLVTTDCSERSAIAFEIAVYQARLSKARITLLAVLDEFIIPSTVRKSFVDRGDASRLTEDYEQARFGELTKLAEERFHGADVTPKLLFSPTSPAVEICRFAESEGVNLIIMTTHGAG